MRLRPSPIGEIPPERRQERRLVVGQEIDPAAGYDSVSLGIVRLANRGLRVEAVVPYLAERPE